METQVEDIPVTIPPVEIDLEALPPHPDQEAKQELVVEVKPKAKPRARSKAVAPVEGHEAQPKPKSRAKKTIIEVIPIVEATPIPEVAAPEPVVEVVAIPDEAVVMKKPKGHRLKNPDTVDMKTKTKCGDCDKIISVHNLNYTHKKHCKAVKQAPTPVMFNESNHGNHVADDPVSKEEMINAYLIDLRKKKVETKKNKYKALVAGALPL